MTNAKFADQDPTFKKACEIAKIEPTKRQASKWRNKRGAAFPFRGSAASAVKRAGQL
jgi:hypothetical protein